MCQFVGLDQVPMPELVAAAKLADPMTGEDIGKLRELSNGCPACMLAALRMAGTSIDDFNFKEESTRLFEAMKDFRNGN